jgi:hypothetical protein
MNILFWIGLLAFIVAYAMFFVRWGSKTEQRWRGRPIQQTSAPSFLIRVRRRFRI